MASDTAVEVNVNSCDIWDFRQAIPVAEEFLGCSSPKCQHPMVCCRRCTGLLGSEILVSDGTSTTSTTCSAILRPIDAAMPRHSHRQRADVDVGEIDRKIDKSRSAQKACMKNPSVRWLGWLLIRFAKVMFYWV